MTFSAWLPAAIGLAGLWLFAGMNTPTGKRIGEIMFFVGLLVTLLDHGNTRVHLP